MILLFTDFGRAGPYMGEMRLALLRAAPEVPVVELMDDAPPCRPDLAAYLLAALRPAALPGDVVVAVVDPGVGGPRAPLAIEVEGSWLVGPDNGLFEPILRRAGRWAAHHISWRPRRLSASFHGRDLFAPVAARLARGDRSGLLDGEPARRPDWPDDLAAVLHVDRFGNATTGLRAALLPAEARLEAAGRRLPRARTFVEVPPGEPFWYENSSGLAEIAASGANAAQRLGLEPGSPVGVAT
jgi:hypothetical protein